MGCGASKKAPVAESGTNTVTDSPTAVADTNDNIPVKATASDTESIASVAASGSPKRKVTVFNAEVDSVEIEAYKNEDNNDDANGNTNSTNDDDCDPSTSKASRMSVMSNSPSDLPNGQWTSHGRGSVVMGKKRGKGGKRQSLFSADGEEVKDDGEDGDGKFDDDDFLEGKEAEKKKQEHEVEREFNLKNSNTSLNNEVQDENDHANFDENYDSDDDDDDGNYDNDELVDDEVLQQQQQRHGRGSIVCRRKRAKSVTVVKRDSTNKQEEDNGGGGTSTSTNATGIESSEFENSEVAVN